MYCCACVLLSWLLLAAAIRCIGSIGITSCMLRSVIGCGVHLSVCLSATRDGLSQAGESPSLATMCAPMLPRQQVLYGCCLLAPSMPSAAAHVLDGSLGGWSLCSLILLQLWSGLWRVLRTAVCASVPPRSWFHGFACFRECGLPLLCF
jgi:hypothetical protein